MSTPRGTIHLYPANEGNEGPTAEEIEEKQDDRGAIGDQLEEIRGEDSEGETRSEIERKRSADTIYNMDLSPYIDSSPIDNSKHIFLVYPEVIGDRDIDGHYFVILDDLNFKLKPTLDFWGSALDFVEMLLHEIPSVSQLIVNASGNEVPNSILKVIQNELWKHNIDLFSGSSVDFNLKKIKDTEEEQIGVETLEKAVTDPTMRSMLQDPYHKPRGLKLSNKISRILKIAYHVIKTPADEVDSRDDRWSIVPDTPSEENEKEAVEKFSTRDEAAARLNEMEGKPAAEEETEVAEEEESITGGRFFIESECRERGRKELEEESITASEVKQAISMHDWLTPEEGQHMAWSLRDNGKQKSLGDWET